MFQQFLDAILPSISSVLPVSPNALALFIAYLYDKQYAPSTVSSYVSLLGYSDRFLGLADPRKAFLSSKCLKVTIS